MTRKSKREIESVVEKYDSEVRPETPAEWVGQYLESMDELETSSTGIGEDPDGEDVAEVCIWKPSEDAVASIWAPVEEIPEWIDVDEDLPVRTTA